MALVVNLLIVIAGVQAIRRLNVRQYPRSDIAVVKVTTAYIGANADLVRGFITAPLEFSTFPTVLLIATMLRLALNLASTRLVLSHGHEGVHGLHDFGPRDAVEDRLVRFVRKRFGRVDRDRLLSGLDDIDEGLRRSARRGDPGSICASRTDAAAAKTRTEWSDLPANCRSPA